MTHTHIIFMIEINKIKFMNETFKWFIFNCYGLKKNYNGFELLLS